MQAEHLIIAAGTVLALLLAAAGGRDGPPPRQNGDGTLRIEDVHNPLPPAVPSPTPRMPGA
ncbi:MAG: hypothetical protein JNM90_04815 [Burkholderiales bacterium]|nr:hypothetical protein [Burkholderiales bacterium]